MASNLQPIPFGSKPLVPPTVPTAGAPIPFGSKPIVPVPAPAAAPGVMQRISSDFAARRKNVADITDATVKGEQTPAEALLQNAGEVVGGAFDIPTEIAKSVIPKPVKDVVKKGVSALGGVINKVAEPLAKAMSPSDIYGQASKFHQEAADLYHQAALEKDLTKQAKMRADAKNIEDTAQAIIKTGDSVQSGLGRASRNVEAGINVGSLLPVGEGVGVGAKGAGKALESVGGALERSGTEAIDAAKQSFAQDLVKPLEDKASKIADVSRTTEKGIGPFKRSVIAPTPEEVRAAEAVSQVPGVSPKNTLQQNFNAIQSENIINAGQLVSDVKLNDFAIPKKEVISRVNAVKGILDQSPIIVGDAKKTADKLLAGAQKFIQENDGTGSGLLQARKDYDQWVLSQKPAAFDAKAENAFTIANREIRKSMTNLLDEYAPNAKVKESLGKQSALYDAMENIAPKAADEANTAIGRALQRVGKVLGTKNKIIQGIAAGVGIGGLGAAATFAPAVAGLGIPAYVLYRAGKFVMSPELRVNIGKLLETAGSVISPEDRAVLQGAVENYKGDAADVKPLKKAGIPNKQGGFIALPPIGQSPTVPILSPVLRESSYNSNLPQNDEKGKVTLGLSKSFPFVAAKTIFGDGKKLDSVPSQDSIANALMQLESSGGKDTSSADAGEKKWLTGLTEVAIKELKRQNMIPDTFDKNDENQVKMASALYFNLMQKRHPDLTPGEVYADYYWTQSKDKSQRDKKVAQFNKLIAQTNETRT